MRDAQAGISFYDVARLFRSVGGANGGHVSAQLYVPVREYVRHAIDVRVLFKRASVGDDGGVYERGVSGVFPGSEFKTLAILLFRLGYELEGKIAAEREVAERATQGRFSW